MRMPHFSIAARLALLLALHSPAQTAFANRLARALPQDFTGTFQIVRDSKFHNGTIVRHGVFR